MGKTTNQDLIDTIDRVANNLRQEYLLLRLLLYEAVDRGVEVLPTTRQHLSDVINGLIGK